VNPERRAAALLVLASLLWGATFVAIHDLVARVDAVILVFARFAIASVVLLPLGAARGRRSAAAIRAGVLSGVLGALGFVFQAIGLHDTTPATRRSSPRRAHCSPGCSPGRCSTSGRPPRSWSASPLRSRARRC
jgi:hypothetical protein